MSRFRASATIAAATVAVFVMVLMLTLLFVTLQVTLQGIQATLVIAGLTLPTRDLFVGSNVATSAMALLAVLGLIGGGPLIPAPSSVARYGSFPFLSCYSSRSGHRQSPQASRLAADRLRARSGVSIAIW